MIYKAEKQHYGAHGRCKYELLRTERALLAAAAAAAADSFISSSLPPPPLSIFQNTDATCLRGDAVFFRAEVDVVYSAERSLRTEPPDLPVFTGRLLDFKDVRINEGEVFGLSLLSFFLCPSSALCDVTRGLVSSLGRSVTAAAVWVVKLKPSVFFFLRCKLSTEG